MAAGRAARKGKPKSTPAASVGAVMQWRRTFDAWLW